MSKLLRITESELNRVVFRASPVYTAWELDDYRSKWTTHCQETCGTDCPHCAREREYAD